jgi:Ca2+-binding EF-hand superfamily protein
MYISLKMDSTNGKNLFDMFDDDDDGFLNFDQVLQIFTELGLPADSVEKLSMDDMVDLDTFLGLFEEQTKQKELSLPEAFQEYDPELTGTIHIGILINILRTKLDSEDINELLRDMEYNDDLVVNYGKILHDI